MELDISIFLWAWITIIVLAVKLKEVIQTSLLLLVLFLDGFYVAVMKLKEMFTLI